MSSLLHQDKSIEELKPIIENFVSNHEKLFGFKPNTQTVIAKLDGYIKAKEEEMYAGLFSGLSAKNLKDVQFLLKDILKSRKW
mgnify:CR=1 FL=1